MRARGPACGGASGSGFSWPTDTPPSEAGPRGRDDVGAVLAERLEPDLRRDDDLAGVRVQPRPPPAEAAVGDDVVLAGAHQVEIPAGVASVVVRDVRRRVGEPEVLRHPRRVVREEEEVRAL